MISSREEFDMWLDSTYTTGIDNWAQVALWKCWLAARCPSRNTYKNEIEVLARYSGVLVEQYANSIRAIAPASLVKASDNLCKGLYGNPSIGEAKKLYGDFNNELYAAMTPTDGEGKE